MCNVMCPIRVRAAIIVLVDRGRLYLTRCMSGPIRPATFPNKLQNCVSFL